MPGPWSLDLDVRVEPVFTIRWVIHRADGQMSTGRTEYPEPEQEPAFDAPEAER